METFDIYNPYGEKTGQTATRDDAHRLGLLHRVIHLWIINRQGQVLVQQRSACKEAGAGLWYVSVGGHIESGEGIEATILRETMEELGVDIAPVKDQIAYLYTFRERKRERGGALVEDEFYDVFALRADIDIADIVMQPSEVQAVKYMAYADFRAAVLSGDGVFWPHRVGYALLAVALDDYIGL